MNLKSKLVLGALMGAVAFAAQPAAAEIDKKEFRVVGTWGFLDHWKEREGPFWQTILPKASGGKLTANAKSNTELGLSGYEVMKLLKLGMLMLCMQSQRMSHKKARSLRGQIFRV